MIEEFPQQATRILRPHKKNEMLRVFKQYYPIRNVFFIIGEGLFIFASVLFASWIVIGFDSFAVDKLLWFKALLVAFFELRRGFVESGRLTY